MIEPRDFQGRLIQQGDVIALAVTIGSHGAALEPQFVREVREGGVLIVQPTAEEPKDKRSLGRVTNWRNCIVIS